jgi:hypothetical protein
MIPKPKVEIPPRPKSRKGLFQYSAPQVDKKYMITPPLAVAHAQEAAPTNAED